MRVLRPAPTLVTPTVFGSRIGAMAGAGIAGGFDGFAAYNNPAGLGLAASNDQRIVFSWGTLYARHNFWSINNVVVENAFTSDKATPIYGNVDTSYIPTFGQYIGLALRLLPEFYNLTVGLTVWSDLRQVAYMDTGEAFAPEYFLYRTRTHRPQLEGAIGADLTPWLHLGVGVHIASTLTASANVFLQVDSQKTSSMRFSSSLKFTPAPYVGLLITPTDDPSALGLGVVVRSAIASPVSMQMNAGARLLGDLAALDFGFKSIAALYYDP